MCERNSRPSFVPSRPGGRDQHIHDRHRACDRSTFAEHPQQLLTQLDQLRPGTETFERIRAKLAQRPPDNGAQRAAWQLLDLHATIKGSAVDRHWLDAAAHGTDPSGRGGLDLSRAAEPHDAFVHCQRWWRRALDESSRSALNFELRRRWHAPPLADLSERNVQGTRPSDPAMEGLLGSYGKLGTLLTTWRTRWQLPAGPWNRFVAALAGSTALMGRGLSQPSVDYVHEQLVAFERRLEHTAQAATNESEAQLAVYRVILALVDEGSNKSVFERMVAKTTELDATAPSSEQYST